MEENSKLPYYAEYAKSGRAGCKGCKENIAKDSLRLAVMVQVIFFLFRNMCIRQQQLIMSTQLR